MARFISISGPSTTGKTSLVSEMKSHPDFKHFKFMPNVNDLVWSDLVHKKIFTEFTEVSTDSEYLCTYIIRMADLYNEMIESWRGSDNIIVLDECWVDLSIYSILQMWYTRVIKSVQEEVLHRVSLYDNDIERIYITKADDKNYPVDKFRIRGKVSTFRENRPLEIRYYEIAKNLKNSIALPYSDTCSCLEFIKEDLENLGYL